MAIVITNGTCYVTVSKKGKIGKTTDINKAQTFYSCNVAMRKIFKNQDKCSGFYPYDTEDTTCSIIDKKSRKQYSIEERKIIYERDGGRCQLCGRKILLNELSVDHIIPLSLGGSNDMDNVQSTCVSCNKAKNNFLPDLFWDKITEIFFYQMEKKYCDTYAWKIARNLLMEIL